MFDKLVESTKQKQQGRSKFYLVTSLIYGASLSVVAIATIIWFNPVLAEANISAEILTLPPIPVPAPPPDFSPAPKVTPDPGFIEPKEPPKEIADAKTVPPLPPKITSSGPTIVGAPNIGNVTGTGIPNSGGCSTCNDVVETAPPPPAPTPKIMPTPTPTPKTSDIVRLTSEMVTGKAIRKVQPTYPYIAKQVKAQGTVPVQITISEEGRVLNATVMGGHPTLQQAAQQAALQWVFSPTVLNGKPVKVSGVISFNFILN
jgi:periplasmic protein TonB